LSISHMTRPARSILVFGIYVVALGVLLTAVPDAVIAPFGFPQAREPWIRVLGVVATVLGGYYIAAARQEVTAFFRWSIWGRGCVLLGFTLLAVAGIASPSLILFGVVDAAGALWTALELRARR
jgi:hypothetical protein